MSHKNKMRFYYKEGADMVSITLPDMNSAPDDRGPMTVEIQNGVTATIDMEVELEEGGRFYPFGEDVEIYATNPDTVVGYELTIKLRGEKVAYWWGKDPRNV